MANRRDEALVAWLSSGSDGRDAEAVETSAVAGDVTAHDATDDAFDVLDVAFDALLSL